MLDGRLRVKAEDDRGGVFEVLNDEGHVIAEGHLVLDHTGVLDGPSGSAVTASLHFEGLRA
jgi:hypothetical protein